MKEHPGIVSSNAEKKLKEFILEFILEFKKEYYKRMFIDGNVFFDGNGKFIEPENIEEKMRKDIFESEEQADFFIKDVFPMFGKDTRKANISYMKQNGYIKQSELKKAREIYYDFKKSVRNDNEVLDGQYSHYINLMETELELKDMEIQWLKNNA